MGKTSVVLELQRLASDSQAKVSDLLRKALLVSTKLKLDDFKTWVDAELRGYREGNIEPPSYRTVQADVKAMNPYRGLIPVQMKDSSTEQLYGRVQIRNALPELEDMTKEDKGQIIQKLPPEYSAVGGMGVTFETYRVISRSQVIGVVETVRTTILEWALKLEAEGILGEDMTFSESDKMRAATSPSVHIESFQGVFGDVTAQNFQIGSYASIHNQLKDAGIPQAERNELENIVDELKEAESAESRQSLSQRGLDWLGRNAKKLGAIADVIRPWFQ